MGPFEVNDAMAVSLLFFSKIEGEVFSVRDFHPGIEVERVSRSRAATTPPFPVRADPDGSADA
jgi:hypothetical protein